MAEYVQKPITSPLRGGGIQLPPNTSELIKEEINKATTQTIKETKEELKKVTQQLTDTSEQLKQKAEKKDITQKYFSFGVETHDSSASFYKLTKFNLPQRMFLNRVGLNIKAFGNGDRLQIALYDRNYMKIADTGIREIFKTGWTEFSIDNIEMKPDTYFIAVTTISLSTKLAFEMGDNDSFISPANIVGGIAPTNMLSLYNSSERLCFRLYENDLPKPIGFEFYEDTDISVFCKNNTTGKTYGWKKSRGRIVETTNGGQTWTELMLIPVAVWGMVADEVNNRLIYVASNGKIFASNGVATSSQFTEITPTNRNPEAKYALPYSINIWNGHLWFGEYSGTVNLGSAQVFRHDLSKPLTSGTWVLSGSFPNCRHIHAFTPDGNTALYLGVGDANYGENIGYHKLLATDIVTGGQDQWKKLSRFGTTATNHYPVDSVVRTIDGVKYLVGASDRVGYHILLTKLDNVPSAGSNINPQIMDLIDSPNTETVRNVIFDDRGNLYFVTEETTKHRILVSPYPYTQSYVLHDFGSKKIEVMNVTKDGQYFWFGHFKFKSVDFQFASSTIRNFLPIYTNGIENQPIVAESSGTGTSKQNKNVSHLVMRSETVTSPELRYTGYRSENSFDLSGYNSLVVDGSIFDCIGEGFLRVSISSDTSVTANTKESLYSIVNRQLSSNNAKIIIDISTITGVHYIHVQAVSMNGGRCNAKIDRIYLHPLIL